ncbi:uncharacterized protein LOC143177733 [Calliopsis andreniformis]|uniref:uncharacterized protein LOC143177733 n=1 Tax=Calliopsis andreniformis TaxID=337506 RepID=UPI003FCD974E
MSEFNQLRDALKSLNSAVSNFPVGVVSLEDLKSIEERIESTRETLKHLNARLLLLKAHSEFQTSEEEPEENVQETMSRLHEETSKVLINDKAVKLCLHSYAIQSCLAGREGDEDIRNRIYSSMGKLFAINDNMLSLQKEIEEALQKRLELKIQSRNSLYRYRKYLEEQEEIQSKKLQEMKPDEARNKKQMNIIIQKINIMQQLILNFIAASHTMLIKEPILVDMLEKYRELITVETVLNMSQDKTQDESMTEKVNA